MVTREQAKEQGTKAFTHLLTNDTWKNALTAFVPQNEFSKMSDDEKMRRRNAKEATKAAKDAKGTLQAVHPLFRLLFRLQPQLTQVS
jgi:hypothetical protein